MELGITPGVFTKRREGAKPRGIREAMVLCREAGFREMDYLVDLNAPDWEARADELRAFCESNDIRIGQCHMPFFRYRKGEDGVALFREAAPKAMRAASLLGARHIVVHADEVPPSGDRYDPKALLAANRAYLLPFVDMAKRAGLRVAVENLFDDGFGAAAGGHTRYTSTMEELLTLIDSFADPCVGCCWDFGHARVAFGDGQLDALRQVGGRLLCTHVHDNYYDRDLHLPPYLGATDWEGHARVLREIGYQGTLSFEFVYMVLPDELLARFLSLCHDAGAYMLAHL